MSLGDRMVVMHEGRVQQVGSPMEVYRNPVNRFVATFVGSPAMNLLEGEVVDGDRGPVFRVAGGGEIPLPPIEHRGPGVLGIRPESIGFEPESTGRGPLAEIEAVERYGDRGDAWLRITDREDPPTVVHRGSAMDLPPEGLRVRITAMEEGLHVFEPGGNGRCLGPHLDE